MTIKSLYLPGLAVLVLLAGSGVVYAQSEIFEDELPEFNSDLEEWRFQEDAVILPDFPDLDKLQKVQIDASFGRLQYFIDPASLKVGRDEVVLMTTIITSDRGARNILFEGYRCDSREYKTLAYGTTNNTFYEVPSSAWKQVFRARGTNQDFRREYLTTYFCDIHRLPLTRDEILRQIAHPTFRDDDGRVF